MENSVLTPGLVLPRVQSEVRGSRSNQEVEVFQEIGAEDGLGNCCHVDCPGERLTEGEFQCQRLPLEDWDPGVVGCVEVNGRG